MKCEAYFTGNKETTQTKEIYPMKCEAYFTGNKETTQTKEIYPACPAWPMKRFCYFTGVM